MFQRILIAWDGSPVAARAFDVAIDITRRYDAELVAVSIAYSPSHAETPADREESADAARTYLRETFREVADRAERAGVRVPHEVVDGEEPARALAAYVHEHGFDLLVCGHHRGHRAGRLLFRGVSEGLLAATAVPILVVSQGER